MWNLERIGKLKKGTMAAQRLGIGFEKLDRAVFEPERAYKKLEQLGEMGQAAIRLGKNGKGTWRLRFFLA